MAQQTTTPQRKHSAATARLQARLERLELAHLREVVAAQADEIERLVQDVHVCEDRADYWQENHERMAQRLNDGTADARSVGLTQAGELLVVTKDGAIDALRNRAVSGLLINASYPPEAGGDGFGFWQGYIKALQDLRNGAGDTLAGLDEARSGYQPPSHLQAAFAALAESAEAATFAEVRQLLATHCVQVAGNAVANGEFDAVEQFKHGVGGIVQTNDEHAPARVDGDDGSCCVHGAAPLFVADRATVAQQGGAA